MFKISYIWCAIAGYLLGSIETAVLLSRLKYKDDIRKHGSGNAGTTNMLRVFGMKSGAVTFVGDFIKGLLSVIVGRLIAGELGGYVCGMFAVIGHDFPAFFGFKGGKGVASTMGIAWMVMPLAAAIGTVLGFAIIYFSQMVSLGSLIGVVIFAVSAIIIAPQNTALIILCVLLVILVVLRHIDNIKRIIEGKESKLFKRKQL